MELHLNIPILVLREENRRWSIQFLWRAVSLVMWRAISMVLWRAISLVLWKAISLVLWRAASLGPSKSGFNLIVERWGKSSGIFLSRISKNFKELIERKFVEVRTGLGALFGIKLYNALKANVVEVEEHEHVHFSKTCKKPIKSLRKLLEKKKKEVELKVIKKYMLN